MSKAHPGTSIKYQKKQLVRDRRSEKRKLHKEAKNALKEQCPEIDFNKNRKLLNKAKLLIQDQKEKDQRMAEQIAQTIQNA